MTGVPLSPDQARPQKPTIAEARRSFSYVGRAAARPRSRSDRRRRIVPYLLLAPSTLFLMTFVGWPLLQSIAIAFHANGSWTTENFARMATDLNFAAAVRNTFALVFVLIPLQAGLAIVMALMLQGLRRGRDLILWIWTIPLGISDLAAGLVWLAILSEHGYLNSALTTFGFIHGPTRWLTYETPVALFLSVVVAELWRATAIVFVIVVAGLQLIPKEYEEAAEVFGATPWRRFWAITLPLLKPSLQSALMLRTILAFEVFAVVFALGGRNLPVLMGEAYVWQYDDQNYGVAAAYAVLVLGISVAATVFYLCAFRVREETTT